MSEFFTMSQKELDRLSILSKVRDGHITQTKAAELLGISDRQIRNLIHALNGSGPQGLISKKRGKPSNHSIDSDTREKILKLIRERYIDFAPTLAAEKLQEYHEINISHETLRQWMIKAHIWVPHVRKRKIHPTRQRKEYFGEMLQADGSHHDWLETGIPCVLIVGPFNREVQQHIK